MMLAWLTMNVVYAYCLIRLNSNSIPTTNIKRQTPIWLNNRSTCNDSPANTNANAPGQSQPSNDGPSKIPAVISPITAGCPNFRKIAPTIWVATKITMNCSNSRPSGASTFSSKPIQNDVGPSGGWVATPVNAARASFEV